MKAFFVPGKVRNLGSTLHATSTKIVVRKLWRAHTKRSRLLIGKMWWWNSPTFPTVESGTKNASDASLPPARAGAYRKIATKRHLVYSPMWTKMKVVTCIRRLTGRRSVTSRDFRHVQTPISGWLFSLFLMVTSPQNTVKIGIFSNVNIKRFSPLGNVIPRFPQKLVPCAVWKSETAPKRTAPFYQKPRFW